MTNAQRPFTEPEVEKQVLNHISTLSVSSIEDARLALVKAGLVQEDFASPLHRSIFNAVGSLLFNKGQSVDPFTVKAELERAQGDALPDNQWSALVDVTMGVGMLTSTSYDSHCRILRDLSIRRLAVGQLDAAAAAARDLGRDPNVVIAEVTSKLSALAGAGSNIQSLRQVMDTLNERYEQVQSGKTNPIVATGIKSLDAIIGGWQPTLNLVAALPGVGKSALFATTAQSIARRGEKVGIISLEDESAWLGYRLWSSESQVDQFVIRFKKTNDSQHEKLADGFTKLNGYWDNIIIADGSDSAHQIESVVAIAQNLIINHKCKCIFVDHLGEVTRGSEERYDLEVSENLSALRRVANAHQVPMVVAMHLKRRDGLGPGDEPRLSDFANSAGAERKARVAIGLSREVDSDTLRMYVLKNTNGKAGKYADAIFSGAAAMLSSVEHDGGRVFVRPAPRRSDGQLRTPPTGAPEHTAAIPGGPPDWLGADVGDDVGSHDNGRQMDLEQRAGKHADWFRGDSFKRDDDGGGDNDA